jgi:hypothetical protein
LVQLILVGAPVFGYYLSEVLLGIATTGDPVNEYLNSSIIGFSSKMFQPSLYVIPLVESAVLATITRYVLTLLMAGVTIFLASRPIAYNRTPARKRDMEFAMVLVAALLLNARFWESGMASFLLVYALLLRDALEENNWRLIGLCVLSFVLVDAHRVIWLIWHEQTLPALMLSFPFFGSFLLWGITAMRAAHYTADTSPEVKLARQPLQG